VSFGARAEVAVLEQLFGLDIFASFGRYELMKHIENRILVFERIKLAQTKRPLIMKGH
jgi:hypothetical protein